MNNIPFIYENYTAAELLEPFCCLTGKRVNFLRKFQFICGKFPAATMTKPPVI